MTKTILLSTTLYFKLQVPSLEIKDDRWFNSWQGLWIFFFTTTSRQAVGPTRPPIRRIPRILSLVVRWPVSETDHSPTTSARVNNAWSYTSIPQYASIVWCSLKAHWDGYCLLYITCSKLVLVLLHTFSVVTDMAHRLYGDLGYA